MSFGFTIVLKCCSGKLFSKIGSKRTLDYLQILFSWRMCLTNENTLSICLLKINELYINVVTSGTQTSNPATVLRTIQASANPKLNVL